jgi:hypothetical protein
MGVMIISDPLQYVYAAIPRTASMAMRAWLRRHYKGRLCYHHHTFIPPEQRVKGYHRFLMVRDPVDRVMSHWRLIRQKGFYQPPVGWPQSFTLRGHLETLLAYKRHGNHKYNETWAFQNQAAYIEAFKPDQVLIFENMPECLDALPFIDNVTHPFPHRNKSVKPAYTPTKEEMDMIHEYNREDYELPYFSQDRPNE